MGPVSTRVDLASEEPLLRALHHRDRLEVRLARAAIQRQAMMSMMGVSRLDPPFEERAMVSEYPRAVRGRRGRKREGACVVVWVDD